MILNLNYTLIETDNDVSLIKASVAKNNLKEIAIDFEGESNLHKYGIHLCLIQINTGKEVFIIDPLKLNDIGYIREILENRKLTKIMFAAEFDVKILKYTHGITIKNIFDLQAGYKILGYEKLGLENIVSEIFGIDKNEITKKQKSDWTKRPLSEEQIIYAINDVSYLFRLKEDITERLSTEQKLQFEEICENMENHEIEKKKYPHLSIKGSGNLSNLEKIFLKHLYNARETVAQKIDFPPFWVIGNRQLLQLAQKRVFKREVLLKDYNFPKRALSMIEVFEKAIYKATEEAARKNLPE